MPQSPDTEPCRAPDIRQPSDLHDQLDRVATLRDKAAFAVLFKNIAPRIKALMLRRGWDAARAEALAQDVMLTIWRHAHLYPETCGSVYAWAYRIARDLQHGDQAGVSLTTLREATQPPCGGPGRFGPRTPPDSWGPMRAALQGLSAEQREILELAYLSNLSGDVIAARLDLPLCLVEKHFRLALQRVRESPQA